MSLVGTLSYISNLCRPDISFIVNYLSRQSHKATQAHLKMARNVFRYLKYTKKYGILYKNVEDKKELKMVAYSDSDWAGDKDTSKSTSGYIILINGSPLSWKSKKQGVIADSTMQAEFIAMALCLKELMIF